MAVRSYRELTVWQRAMDLVEEIYLATKDFPTEERYGLTTQMRRSAVAIPSNIAEGQGRETTNDFLRFLSIAYGSLMEVETHILLADRLAMLAPEIAGELLGRTAEVGRLLNGLRNALHSRQATDH